MKQPGQIKIGHYQIQSHLVRGGMADIYLAHDSKEDKIVAIKMVHESAGEYCERFQREVRAMAGLVHAHILPVFDYGEHESWYYLVTPYIEYGTLNGRLDAGPLTLEEVDPILAQLAEALQFAHEQGVVHRDVKPSNVLMRDGHYVYLADFGLVKRVGQENGLTVTGYLIGTPEYMAPELAEEDATPQSDVYALGVLLYQMLTGRVPFKANTPMGVFLRHIRETPELPSTLNAAIPPEVEEVILRAMEKDLQRRYQSAQELYLAYQQAVKSAVARHGVVVDPSPQLLVNQLPKAGVVDVKRGKQRGKMRRSLIVAGLAAVFLVTIVSVLISSVFFFGGWGNNTHAADARDAKNRNISTSAAKDTTLGHPIDTATSKHSATGSTDENATDPTTATNLNQYPGSLQRSTSTAGKSGPGGISIGVNGQVTTTAMGTTTATGTGNGGAGNLDIVGSGSSGSFGGQSTGSGGGQSTVSGGNPIPSDGNGHSGGGGGRHGNDGGGVTPPAPATGSGTGGVTPTATGSGTGGVTPTATGSGTGGVTPTATGSGTGGVTPTATGSGTGGVTPTATGSGTGGVTPTATSGGTVGK